MTYNFNVTNKPLQDQLKQQFYHRYALKVQKKTKDSAGGEQEILDLKLDRLKSFGLQWLVNACSHL